MRKSPGLPSASPPSASPPQATSVPRPSPNQSASYGSSPYDAAAERELLDLANRARAQAGAPPLQMDEGLTQAARAHSKEMAAHNQLSHQFSGEPGLTQRLAATSTLHMDQAGENVGYAASAAESHDGFMHSPPHRENLLDPAFNVAGFGVIHNGDMLFVTQDFGHSLPSYSDDKAQDDIADAVAKIRAKARLAPLKKVQADAVQTAACAMSKADALTHQFSAGRYILRYTSNTPAQLPMARKKPSTIPPRRCFQSGSVTAAPRLIPPGFTGLCWSSADRGRQFLAEIFVADGRFLLNFGHNLRNVPRGTYRHHGWTIQSRHDMQSQESKRPDKVAGVSVMTAQQAGPKDP